MSDDELRNILIDFGIRPTRQRVSLIDLLLESERRPATIKSVVKHVQDNRRPISRATVRKSLRAFERSGLMSSCVAMGSRETCFTLNQLPANGSKADGR
ncbi:transcriptional repressor [Bradyrhizobium japonicum]|uniref:transcriptional repressor n=1 Tax=Bradyrhizobium japonicum TaxID=375 RepID=UPI001BA503A6|nr:transcriptional repressor [Bradyrhizobium japonicum]